MTTYDTPARRGGQSFSIPSIVAILAAIATFFTGSGILTIVLAVSAVVAGLIGVVLALSPNVRGGIVSTIAVILGLLGVLVGGIRGISNLLGGNDDVRTTTPVVVDGPAGNAY